MSLLRNLKVVKILGRLKKSKGKKNHVLDNQKTTLVKWCVDHWNTSGGVELKELEKVTGKTFGVDTQTMTVSDFVKLKLHRMPNPGDEIIENGLSFLVLNIKSFRAGEVQVRLIKPKHP